MGRWIPRTCAPLLPAALVLYVLACGSTPIPAVGAGLEDGGAGGVPPSRPGAPDAAAPDAAAPPDAAPEAGDDAGILVVPTHALAFGDSEACARRDDGTLLCWGYDSWGQLGGGGGGELSAVPVPVSTLTGVAQPALGGETACAVLTDGTADCWGSNLTGQLGFTADNLPIHGTPAPVPGLSGVLELGLARFGGDGHSCALLADGTVQCWGSNDVGQLGDGTLADRAVPAGVPGLAGVTSIAVGGWVTYAVLADGTAVCWGDDGKAVLKTPAPVNGLSGAKRIAVGAPDVCALMQDATVQCWIEEEAPAPVEGLTGIVQIALGTDSACALTQAGLVLCWGSNGHGQLGDGTTIDHMTPASVVGLSNVTEVVVGAETACARISSGAVYCWGSNFLGQVGDGTQTDRSSPVLVVP